MHVQLMLLKQDLQEQMAFSCAGLVLVRVSSVHKYSLEICYATTDLNQICLDYRIFITISQAGVEAETVLKQRGFIILLKELSWPNLNKNITY